MSQPHVRHQSSTISRSALDDGEVRKKKNWTHIRKFLELDLLQKIGIVRGPANDGPVQSVCTNASILRLAEDNRLAPWRVTVRKTVQSRWFMSCMASAIVLNAAYIGIDTDLGTTTKKPWQFAIEILFTLVFMVELILRAVAAKSAFAFFKDGWNNLDFILVSLSCIDTFILSLLVQWEGGLQLINTLRTVRLARVVRLFRLFHFFRELWNLVSGIIDAMHTLLWTWMLLALLIYISGIFATRTIGQPNNNNTQLDEYFGTVPKSMFTLFQVTTTEGWADVARTAMEFEAWSSAFFILYMYVTTFVALNVVVAVIVENTLDQASDQREKNLAKQDNQRKQACARIYKVFKDADLDGNGVLTKEEFMQEIRNEDVKRYLHQLGIDLRQAENLFSILDYDESDSLDAEEFVGGMLKAVGIARAKDVLALQCDCWRSEKKVRQHLATVRRHAEAQMTAIESGVSALRRDVTDLAKAIGCPLLTQSSFKEVVPPPQQPPASAPASPPGVVSAWCRSDGSLGGSRSESAGMDQAPTCHSSRAEQSRRLQNGTQPSEHSNTPLSVIPQPRP